MHNVDCIVDDNMHLLLQNRTTDGLYQECIELAMPVREHAAMHVQYTDREIQTWLPCSKYLYMLCYYLAEILCKQFHRSEEKVH